MDILSVVWPSDTYGRCRNFAVGVVSYYIVKKIYTRLMFSSLRSGKFATHNFPNSKDYPPGTLILHQFSRGKTCANLSPFALKVECFLRISDIPYMVDSTVPFGPKTKCPWINVEGSGEPIGDSQFIVNVITEKELSQPSPRLPAADKTLSARDMGALDGMRCLVEEQLFWCVIYWRYHLDNCRVFLTTQRFPRFLNFAFPLFMSGAIKKKAVQQGIARHTPDEVLAIARDTCRALDGYLGESPFFCGPSPGTADCSVFGGLAQIRWNAPDTSYEALVTEVFPRLGAYCDRMKNKVFPDWNILIQEEYKQ